MKGYKAFEKGMICKGKQYAENTVFEEDEAVICEKGIHFCKDPIDVLDYYPLVDENGDFTEFAEVEALAPSLTDDDKKFVTKKLKIGAKLSFADFIKVSFSFDFEKFKKGGKSQKSEDDAKIASSGNCAQIASSGDFAKIASSGGCSQIGSSGYAAQIASLGYAEKIASSGNCAKIGSSGDCAKIGSSGYAARIGSLGDFAQIASSGDCAKIGSSGNFAVIMCAGQNSRAKAKKGSWITLAEWEYNQEKSCDIPVCVKTEFVDGEKIKEDTFYILKNGEFIEVE